MATHGGQGAAVKGSAAAVGPAPSYLELALARFGEAVSAVGCIEAELVVAGRVVRLRFAGPALVPRVLPALAHLARPRTSDVADLTVHLWDTSSTGVARLRAPCAARELGPDGTIRGFATHLRASLRDGTGSWPILDLERGVAAVQLGEAGEITDCDAGIPLLHLFHTFFGAAGLTMVHAAAVGRPDGGVLLGGSGGSGKSTTALLCLDAGLSFAGDDHVLVDVAGPVVHSVYATGKVEPGTTARFPRLASAFASAAAPPPGEKIIAYLGDMSRGFPLRALVLPRVSGRRETEISPLPAALALRTLAPSTILQLPADGARTLASLASLCRRVPCFRLDVGTDLSQIPRAIERLLEREEARR